MKITPEIMAACKPVPDLGEGFYRYQKPGDTQLRVYKYENECLGCKEPHLSVCFNVRTTPTWGKYCDRLCSAANKEYTEEGKKNIRQSNSTREVSVLCRELSRQRLLGHKESPETIEHKRRTRILNNGEDEAKNALLLSYRCMAKNSHHAFALSREEFLWVTQQNCAYCGVPPAQVTRAAAFYGVDYIYNGVDRVDNTQGYSVDNVVAACRFCNQGKSDSTVSQFLNYVCAIHTFDNKGMTKVLEQTPDYSRAENPWLQSLNNRYMRGAVGRHLVYDLSLCLLDDLTRRQCSYCGAVPFALFTKTGAAEATKQKQSFLYTGIDRLDPKLGYTEDNVTSCCKVCNWMKNAQTLNEFYAWVTRIVQHNGLDFVPSLVMP